MKINHLAGSVAMLLFIIVLLISAGASEERSMEKIRVIAHSDTEISQAISLGCTPVRDARTMKALLCPKGSTDSMGLKEDTRVFVFDSGANAQIGADIVQASGNTGSGRKIVILDTGYNYAHPELSGSYLGGWDFVNNDSDPMDDHGHGSHVAGIITADGIDPRARGVASDAGIIAGKILDRDGSGYFSDVIAAIYWAVDGPDGIPDTTDDFNADAISMSFGTEPPDTYDGFCNNVEPDVTEAIKYALKRGVVPVVAAGNWGSKGVSIPGCISYSVTVGAVYGSDEITGFSGTGKAVDITAPGFNIFSTRLCSSYYGSSGTSFATPMVSGTVALIKSANPQYNAHQVEIALFQSAKDLGMEGKDPVYGWGRVNSSGAVNITLS